jgi:hypothetical protein
MTDEHRYEIDIFWSDADQAYVAPRRVACEQCSQVLEER